MKKAPSTGANLLWAWVELNYLPHGYQKGLTSAVWSDLVSQSVKTRARHAPARASAHD